MTDEHRDQSKMIYSVLKRLESLSKEAIVTGTHEGGEKICIRQFNRVYKKMIELKVIPDDLFEPLEEGASFGDIRVSCALIIDHVERVYSHWFQEEQSDALDESHSLKTFGEKVRELLPDMVKRGPRKFSRDFKQVMQKAREEAVRLESNYIGEEHLLLAITKHSAWRILEGTAVRLDELQEALERSSGVALDVSEGHMSVTNHAKQIIDNAVQEAAAMKLDLVEVDHLVLALIRDKEGSAGRALATYNIDYKDLRSGVQRRLVETKKPVLGQKFSDQFKKAMEDAREEAHRLLHDYIATEHLLLAIMMDPDTNAARILQKLNIDVNLLKQKIEEACAPTVNTILNKIKKIPFTPRAKQALEIAAHESHVIGARLVDTEHLLLALVRDKKSIASQILATVRVDEDTVREQVMKMPNTGSGHSWKFTERFKRTMQLAREESARLQHDYIGTEHLLLAVIRNGEGTAVAMLTYLEIDLDDLKQATEEAVDDQAGSLTAGQIPFTPLAKQTLEKAAQEAYMLDAGHVGTGHLILALMAIGQGIAGVVLTSKGATYDRLREAIEDVEDE